MSSTKSINLLCGLPLAQTVQPQRPEQAHREGIKRSKMQVIIETQGATEVKKLSSTVNKMLMDDWKTWDKNGTWLPSFCQKTAGGGLPLVPQRKVTVRPGAVIWSRGRTTI